MSHVSRKMREQDSLDADQDKQAKTHRENQQLLVYIFVALVITTAWAFGTVGFSFIWVFALIVLTFIVWWGKVIVLTEQHIRQKEMVMHRKRALRQSETGEWLNFIFNRWWVFSSNSIFDILKKNLDVTLNDIKPLFIENIELQSFTLGERTPYITYLQVYESGEGLPGGKKPLSWSSVVQPPTGLPQAQQYQVVIEADVGMQSDDFKMIFRTRLGGKWLGSNQDVAVEKLNITGKMQFFIHMDMDAPFPHVSSVSVSFIEKPEVWFSIRVLKAVQMMEIPVLKSWIHSLVMDGLTQALVDPGKVEIKVESTGPTNVPAKSMSKSKAQGILTVTISGEQVKGSDEATEAANPLVFVDDIRYCALRLGEQREHTQHVQGHGAWQDTCSFLVDNAKTDKLIIKSKNKILLSTYTLAQFEVLLSDYPLEHKQRVDTTLEEKVSKRQGGGAVKLDLILEYTALSTVDEEMEMGLSRPKGPVDEVAGVLYVCIHNASNLLGLDRNGFSDPYCIVYSNGKKIKTTHYICRTKNPKWDVDTEFIVGDVTKTMLSFILYDWDGRNASEDDFLGSAHIVLSKEEPSVIRRSLTLGYNLLNVGQVDNNKLGTITVSVIFRPVASVAKSESPSLAANAPYTDVQNVKSKNFINTARQRLSNPREKKTSDSMNVGGILSLGHGLLELNIVQARDLVAMDSNGFSDPYCEVRINNERKFTTSIKKKTLNPVWDEWVTTQLPKSSETLDVVVWDRDPFFRKDFLGSLTFTYEDLRSISANKNHSGWFQLQRIRSGELMLHFSVISEDMNPEDGDNLSPTVLHESGKRGSSPTETSSPAAARLDTQDLNVTGSHNCTDAPHSADIFPEGGKEQETTVASVTGDTDPGTNDLVVKDTVKDLNDSPSQKPNDRLHVMASTLEAQRKSADVSNSNPTKRKFSFRLKRSNSDANLNSSAIENGEGTRHRYHTMDRSSTTNRRDSFSSSGGSSAPDHTVSTMSLAPTEKYFGVLGLLTRIRGVSETTGNVYCKVRLDNRRLAQRAYKYSSGRVVAKSSDMPVHPDITLDFPFEVDTGGGVAKEALLIFDLKISQKSHIATKGYSLADILGDSQKTKKWLPLGRHVEVEVELSHSNSPRHEDRKNKGLFGFMKKSSKKAKEQ